ncbi:MAG TPA: hypothetical protein VGI73_04955 [Solirubrobacterales bacterium]|jgi:hypothetical protein
MSFAERAGSILVAFHPGAWRLGRLMQSPPHFVPRFSLLAVCVMLAAAIGLLVPVSSGAQSSPVAAIKQCRHRFAGKGEKRHQAERRCIENARSKQQPKPASPTEVPSASAGAPGSSPTPGFGAEAVGPPAPSLPIRPPAPETPPPLEIEMAAARVTVGSAIYRNPPVQLTSVSTIESTTGVEPGVTVQIEGEQLVISASAEAAPALLHLVIAGTACTASECDREVLIRLRLTVQPTMTPLLAVDPNGPTSGPAGFGPQVTTPSCGYLKYGFDGSSSWSSVAVSNPKETFDTHTPSSLSIGPHQIWLECLTGRGGPTLWWSQGFELTVTGPSIPIGLESTMVPAGGELVFTTGPSLSAAQCPLLPGITADELLLDLNNSGGSLVNHRNVPMPDGLATERLVVPPGSAAGTYSVLDRCIYGNVAGERAIYEFARQPGEITVTAG